MEALLSEKLHKKSQFFCLCTTNHLQIKQIFQQNWRANIRYPCEPSVEQPEIHPNNRMTVTNSTQIAPGIVRRLAAMFYDVLLLVALWFATAALLLAASGGLLADVDRPLWLLVVLQVSLILVTFLFFAGFWVNGGQTLGMLAWRLKLVTASGKPVNWKQAILRFAAAIPSIGLMGAGLLWMLVDHERLAAHDRLTGTRLILLEKNTTENR